MNKLKTQQHEPRQRRKVIKVAEINVVACLCLLLSCYHESTIPVNADFKVEVAENNFAVPATIKLTNQTSGADWYQWQIDGGATYSSTQHDPGQVVINQAGTHTVTLTAGNRFEQNQKSASITLDAVAQVNFSTEIVTNNFAPVTVKLTNNTLNGDQYLWRFPGAQPQQSSEKNPVPVVYNLPGKYTITLEVTAGRKTYSKQQEIEVLPPLEANWDYRVDFIDQDNEVPVKVYLENKCTSATSYQWTFEGGLPAQSTEANPTVVFNESGAHQIRLTCSNQKTVQSKEMTLQLKPNSGLQVFKGIKLGIFSARNTVGSFFSFSTGKVYLEKELTSESIGEIDLIYFGFSPDFKLNCFVSPSEMANYGFIPFTTGTSAVFYNSPELCSCNFQLNTADFEAIQTGSQLNNMDLSNLGKASQKQFDNSALPRMVPFVLADGRKGIIRINQFNSETESPSVIVDIKVEKPRLK